MKSCQRCKSERILEINGKVSDRFSMWDQDGKDYSGHMPYDLGISTDGDTIDFHYCLDCGQIQGEFPVNGEVEAFKEFEDEYTEADMEDTWADDVWIAAK